MPVNTLDALAARMPDSGVGSCSCDVELLVMVTLAIDALSSFEVPGNRGVVDSTVPFKCTARGT